MKPYRTIEHLNMLGKGSGAYISCEVGNNGPNNGYNIIVSDCHSKSELHGSLNRVDSRQNAIHKIDTLINSLIKTRNHIVAEAQSKGMKIFNKNDPRNEIKSLI